MQVSTISFYQFVNPRAKLWAFLQMQFAHKHLASCEGLEFYKLMGTGKGMGFDPRPDWSVYALLQVWNNIDAAKWFFEHSDISRRYRETSSRHFTLYMNNVKSLGSWSGGNPFQPDYSDTSDGPIAVITRATIKWSKMRTFWSYVPKSEEGIHENPGLIFTKGIGEWPIRQMATFSLWKSVDDLNAFAYRKSGHIGAIQRTRKLKWYSEELFSRFRPIEIKGDWKIDL
jgi:hypothetical protein